MEEAKTVPSNSDGKEPHANRKSRINWRIIALLSLFILAIVAALCIAGVVTGRLVVVVKNPGARVLTISSICGDNVITNYNNAMDRYDQGYTDALNKIESIVGDFSKQSGFDGDPNCVYIKFKSALFNSDYISAQAQIDAISKLSSQGKYADPRLSAVIGIDSMRSALNAVRPSTQEELND